MSLTLLVVLVIGAALVATKIYFQERERQVLENEKRNEQIVSDRLAEIAEFEKEVDSPSKKIVSEVNTTEVTNKQKKTKSNYKKPVKKQPKIKAKE